ncbi:serine/threonine protein kinase [Akkermansiaceae bacterium]|nr:serine/threonine protein kinase [Akkermansiaceae bacterium]
MDRYKIIKLIGEGRSGEVYEAEDTVLNRKVALRRFENKGENEDLSVFKDKFEEFSQILSAIQHPCIATIYASGTDEGGSYIVSQLLTGSAISESIKSGPMEVWEVLQCIEDLLDVLESIHDTGLVHGGLNLSSVMREPKRSGGYRSMVTDFGLAKLIPLVNEGNEDKALLGDFFIMAPELFDGVKPSAHSDLYMLGHLAYTCLAGTHPYEGLTFDEAAAAHKAGNLPRIKELNDSVPAELSNWLEHMMKVDPAERPQTASEASKLLTNVKKLTAAIPRFVTSAVTNSALRHTSPQPTLTQPVSIMASPQAVNTAPGTTFLLGKPHSQQANSVDGLVSNVVLPKGVIKPGNSLSENKANKIANISLVSIAVLLLIGGGALITSQLSVPDEGSDNGEAINSSDTSTEESQKIVEAPMSTDPTAKPQDKASQSATPKLSIAFGGFRNEKKLSSKHPLKWIIDPKVTFDYVCVTGVPLEKNAKFGTRNAFNSFKILGKKKGVKYNPLTYNFVDKVENREMIVSGCLIFREAQFKKERGQGYLVVGQVPKDIDDSFKIVIYSSSLNLTAKVIIQVGDISKTHNMESPEGRSRLDFVVSHAKPGEKIKIQFLADAFEDQTSPGARLILNGVFLRAK